MFDKPPSAGSHGLRRSSALAAYQRLRAFLDIASDCAGACAVGIYAPDPLDPEIRALFPDGDWHGSQWSIRRRSRPSDPDPVLPYDTLEEIFRRLASAGRFDATVRFQYLHRDPRTGALLPYEDADFEDSPEPWSTASLSVIEGKSSAVSLVMTFPWSEITDEIVAVNDAAVATLGITLTPEYWMLHTPSKKRGKLGRRKRIRFDRNAWVAAMHDDEAPFLAEIASDLDDDGPRQVYADVLLAKGDPRGAFINAQCELARLDASSPRHAELAVLERRLLREHGKQWSRVPGKLRPTLRRGFVEHVRVALLSEYTTTLDALFTVAPTVTGLEIDQRLDVETVRRLVAACVRHPLRDLSLVPTADVLPELARAGVLTPLRRLAVQCRDVAVMRDLVRLTCDADELPELASLVVNGPAVDFASVSRIVASSSLPRLARLVVGDSALSPGERAELVDHWPIITLA